MDAPPKQATQDPGASPAQGSVPLALAWNVFAALAYSAANVALRQLAEDKSFDWALFVTATKATGAASVAWILIATGFARGENLLPPRRYLPSLLLAAFCTQVVGNLVFQYTLTLGGLAITMPLVFSAIILSAATFGWIFLGERVTPLLVAAAATLIGAIVVLSFGADAAARDAAGEQAPQTLWVIVLSLVAGTGYGATGVCIRHARVGGVSAAGSLVLISSSGLFGLGALAVWRLGPTRILATSPESIGWMAMASASTAAAFFSLAYAYRVLPVVRVNLINSSQSAICAIAGVALFLEPATSWLVTGTVLTVVGLVLVAYAKEA